MENALSVARLVLRQDAGSSSGVPEDLIGTPGFCDTGNEYDGRMGVRISSIFVILVGSCLGKRSRPPYTGFFPDAYFLPGAWFPVFARRHAGMGVPEWAFFVAKFFGSGVIIATAFIHVRDPLHKAWRLISNSLVSCLGLLRRLSRTGA